tara:strand:+ start:791 stop:2971 length:2181 start_codon:yes stop_codon:yes gene_type:complete
MSSFGDYQDTLINHQTTQISHHTTNHSKLEDIKTKLDAVVTNTANINVNVGDVEINVADMEVLQTATNGKLDTINTTLSSGIAGLPASLTGSGNLKVSLQELGNEGSERLNVDVGTTVSQLPTALTGEGNLKVSIQEDFTHNLSTSEKQDTANGHLGNIDAGVDVLEACCGSNKVNVNISSGGFDGAVTNGALTELASAINSDKVDVNISSGNITGFSTSAKQDTANGHLNTINSVISDLATESTLQIISEEFTKCDTDNITITGGLTGSGNLKVCIQELGNEGSERLNVDVGNAIAQLPTALSGSGRLKIENDFDGAVTNGALTELASAINSDKVDVNISSGNISGFSTATLQGGGLPSALTGSGNLKVCIQELGNEGSERLNVDIGNAVAQLPTALSGSGRLKIENDFDGAVTNGALTELASAINSDRLDVNIANGGFSGAVTNAGLTALNNSIGSNKVNVNISSGGFDGAVTNGALTELASALNSDRLDVNIANGGFGGAVTNAGLTSLNNSIGSNKVNVNISSGGFDGAVTNGALTELASALNSDRLDVNIANGGFDGAVTNAGLTALNGAIGLNKVQCNIASGTVTANLSATDNSAIDLIGTKNTLHTTSELKELLSGVTVNAGAASSEFDFENYRHARFFGITTASIGTDIIVMGSNTSGGVYYVMGENCRSETLGSTHYIYSPHMENLPRYIKIFNKSGSTNYIFTKLYIQLSEGRVAV